jgi:hypothetical protein
MSLEWLEKNEFIKVGKFIAKSENTSGVGVEFIDTKFVNADNNWVYAFRLGDEIKYIGETAQTLSKRMRLYYLEARTDSTNANMRERIKNLLSQNQILEIYAQKAPWVKIGNREIQIRVDLEISMIQELRPEWNKKGLYKAGFPPSRE